MGDFDNTSGHKVGRRRAVFGGRVLSSLTLLTAMAFITLVIGFSAPATADESHGPIARSNESEPAGTPSRSMRRSSEMPVSTSPQGLDRRSTPSALKQAGDESTTRPLTRAAARQQIEEMNPLDWLAAYGPVTIAPAN
jgi:hypothetical protein